MGMQKRLQDLRDDLTGAEDARGWLARHRLPVDGHTVTIVEERRLARRRGRLIEMLVYLLTAGIGWWLVARDQIASLGDLPLSALWFGAAAVVAGDVVRRHVLWGRWDRRVREAMPVRVASLRAPTWDDLVGERAVRRAVVLVGAGLLFATWVGERDGGRIGWLTAYLTVLAAVHAGVLLELARRRPMPAGDETALAVNDRLRGEEAGHAVMFGLFWVVLAPAVSGGSNYSWTLVFFVGYLFVVRAVRHRYGYLQVDGRLVAR